MKTTNFVTRSLTDGGAHTSPYSSPNRRTMKRCLIFLAVTGILVGIGSARSIAALGSLVVPEGKGEPALLDGLSAPGEWDGARQSPPPDGARPVAVLVLLGEWFGDAYFPLKDEIAARGWTMKRVGVDVEYRGCYNKKRDVVLRSDILVPDLKDFTGYDCLIIPSGPQFRKFKENPAVLQFVRDAYAAGLLLASFCVGNNVVKDAGLIDLPFGPDLFPEKVTMVRERVLIGPRGGGPPPGDGFESAPVKEICDAIARELEKRPSSAHRSEAVPPVGKTK